MTGRTHDLAAFATLTYVVATHPLPQLSLGTALVALGANFVGGLAPDIDQPTGNLWRRLPAGSIFGRIFSPFFGGHRHISHSILGVIIFGVGLRLLLDRASHVVLINMNIVWVSFMIGFLSHLVADTFTHDGVPYFFPLPLHLGIPPIKALRMHTGGVIEKFIVFPALLILTGVIFYHYHIHIVQILRSLF